MGKPRKESDSGRSFVYFAIALGTAGLLSALIQALLPLLKVLVPLLAGWWVWRRYSRVQSSQRDALNAIFYQLIEEHQGRVTILDFAIATKLPAPTARHYLDDRAKEFSAHFETTEQGDVVYFFPGLRWSPNALNQPVNPAVVQQSDQQLSAAPLNQAQLAKRLGVSANTIRRKKFSPHLMEWSRSRDPDRIGWFYLAQSRRFFPCE